MTKKHIINKLPSDWILNRKHEIKSEWSDVGEASGLACTVRAIIEFLDKEYKSETV